MVRKKSFRKTLRNTFYTLFVVRTYFVVSSKFHCGSRTVCSALLKSFRLTYFCRYRVCWVYVCGVKLTLLLECWYCSVISLVLIIIIFLIKLLSRDTKLP